MADAEASNSLINISPNSDDFASNSVDSETKVTGAGTSHVAESQRAELFLASIGLQPSSSKEPKEPMSEPKSLDPSTQLLPPGWRKIYVQRMGGKSAGKYDAYIYSPDGRKHRSKTDLLAYLTKRGIADRYNIDSFDFTVRSVSVAESVDNLNNGTPGVLQTKERKSNGNSTREKLEKSRKRKAGDGSEKPRIKKVKRPSLENCDDIITSNISEKKVLKKAKKFSVYERQEKRSASSFKKCKASSPSKMPKHSASFRVPRKLKIKLNFSPRIKRETEFTNKSAAEFTANGLLHNGLDVKSSEQLEQLGDRLYRLLEDSADAYDVSLESPELFDAERGQRLRNHSSLDFGDVWNNADINGFVDAFTDTKEFSNFEIASDRNSCGVSGSERNHTVEECNNNASKCANADISSGLLCTKAEAKTNRSCSKIDGKRSFAVNHFMTVDQSMHSSSKQWKMEEWIPPQSPYNLIEESLGGNPWKVLVTSIFMDSKDFCLYDSGHSKKTLRQFFKLCPAPEALESFSVKKIGKISRQVGVPEDVIVTIKKFSEEYLTTKWEDPTTLHGITSYGKDSYRMFCVSGWKQIAPEHPKLKMYHNWLWQNHRTLGIN